MTDDSTTGTRLPAAVTGADPGTVTVWSDISCPWATLALTTLHAAAAARSQHLRIDHRAFPLELVNRVPTPRRALDAEVVAIAGLRPELGWSVWPGPDATYPVTTLPALEAVQAAKSSRVGGLTASDELDAALRTAFYVEGRCISLHSVVLEVADQCEHVQVDALRAAMAVGAGRAEVYRDGELAQGAAVRGSASLFTGDGYAEHNPGVDCTWAGPPGRALPRLAAYDAGWADCLLDRLGTAVENEAPAGGP
jgi:predicted DsbA family dithiol-disulfide isomerase